MGAGHSHAGHDHTDNHTDQEPSSPQAKRFTLAVLIPAAVVVAVAMLWLWPGRPASPEQAEDGAQRVTGNVIEVQYEPCPEELQEISPELGASGRCGTVTVRLTSGPDAGEQITTSVPNGPAAPVVEAGDPVILMYLPGAMSGQAYQIIDHQRGGPLWLLAVAFAGAVIAFGRWRGVRALCGLGITFAVLLFFIIPAILEGSSPLLVAIVGSAAIMLSVLYLTHGFTTATSIAVAGTLASLTLTGVLAAIATNLTRLTGVADEQTNYLSMVHGVDMRGLLLAGILIGSLGVLDDIAVTQAATVTELARANPAMTSIDLYRAATRIGRAHITSVINTIILAYAGASLPLLILLAAGNQGLGEVLTGQLVAQEIVRSIVGTLGLIAAVPITTALAALAARPMPGLMSESPHQESPETGADAGADIKPHSREFSTSRASGTAGRRAADSGRSSREARTSRGPRVTPRGPGAPYDRGPRTFEPRSSGEARSFEARSSDLREPGVREPGQRGFGPSGSGTPSGTPGRGLREPGASRSGPWELGSREGGPRSTRSMSTRDRGPRDPRVPPGRREPGARGFGAPGVQPSRGEPDDFDPRHPGARRPGFFERDA